MNQIFFKKKIQELWKLIVNGKERHVRTVEDQENEEYRVSMRGQFQKLRDRGLSIRIVTL